jgi:chemotaxis protein CheX
MTEINEEIHDAVGEISNMVAGHVTTKIAETGKKVKVKFKEIKLGRESLIDHVQGAEHVLALPFSTTKGMVLIEVAYAQ